MNNFCTRNLIPIFKSTTVSESILNHGRGLIKIIFSFSFEVFLITRKNQENREKILFSILSYSIFKTFWRYLTIYLKVFKIVLVIILSYLDTFFFGQAGIFEYFSRDSPCVVLVRHE